MSIIETLTEGIVNRDMQKEGQALLDKWSATGLLEGIESTHKQHTMARLLENQAKELLREANTMEGGNIEGFAAVAFPIVRRVFAGLIANDLVSVQPMSLPSGLIFFLDFTFERVRAGNMTTDDSIYGQGVVGSEITGGVTLSSDTLDKQPYGFLAPYSSATASATVSIAALQRTSAGESLTAANVNGSKALSAVLASADGEKVKKLLEFDPDALADTSKFYRFVTVAADEIHEITDNYAKEYMSAINLTNLTGNVDADADSAKIMRRLTRRHEYEGTSKVAGGERSILFVIRGDTAMDSATATTATYPAVDQIGEVSNGKGALVGGNFWPLEGESDMGEIDIKVDSIPITAGTKKLKAKWTPELGQDLNAYHNLDAEVELTSILSEQIALELDREILGDLVRGATAGTYYWSRSPGLFVNKETGAELGATAAAPDFTGTVSEWYETLIETINDVSAQIHRKTLRGGANFVVCSPEVANILEFTSGFRANVTADADKGTIGAVKAGSLSRKFDVIVDPYFPRTLR